MGSSSVPVQLPGPVRQIGYVVTDIEEQIGSWLGLGIGPWYVLRGLSQRSLYRGSPCEVTVTLAFSHSGHLQVELIQQHDDAPSIYTEFLGGGNGGFHQLAWWADDFDAALESIHTAGRPVVWSGGAPGGARYAYFEPPSGPAPIIEVSEYTPGTAQLATMVRNACEEWDGRDPIRSL
ncbi:VOC family protein [Nocardia sp. CA-290969]|uniref:VOC family protein n=1 Tax=Nocardia sp. CA-290969 TaxID=3239986 RepID=UPI003D8D358F